LAPFLLGPMRMHAQSSAALCFEEEEAEFNDAGEFGTALA